MSDPVSPIDVARRTLARAVAAVRGLSRPAKILAASTAVTVVLIGAYIAVSVASDPYTTLFSNLDREDAANLVAKLKEKKIPYRLQGDGSTIEVPESHARETRLELAGSGLPRGAGIGFESFDKPRLGATEFEQRVLFRRALEGELARTFGTLSAIQSARVHLVLPERSVFVSKNEPASASVMLKLKPGATLGTREVAAMVNLAASSVPGLTVDRVTVVTTEGAMLHRPRTRRDGEGDATDDERVSQFSALETSLEERARVMLERVLGAGHVDVRVTVDVDSARMERVEDRYNPRPAPMRSEQWSIERAATDDGNTSAAGIPGAESNLPDSRGAADADGGVTTRKTPAGTIRESHNRAFDVDHVLEKRVVPAGTLRRITVAVLVDGTPTAGGVVARSPEELAKLSSLVRSAVGADDKRGDAVTVESIPFLLTPSAEDKAAVQPSAWAKIPPRWRWAAIGAGVLVTVLAVGLSVRALRKAKARASEFKAPEQLATGPHGPPALMAADVQKEVQTEDLRAAVHERAAADPASAALVLRFWLGNEDLSGKATPKAFSERPKADFKPTA